MASNGLLKRHPINTCGSHSTEISAPGTTNRVNDQATVSEDTMNHNQEKPCPSEVSQMLPPPLGKLEKIAHWAWNSISFESLPKWLQDNEFLKSSHRPPMNSFIGCFKSMFRMHTETWNIWTHLIGFSFFLVLVGGIYIFGDYITYWFEDVQIRNLPWDEQFMLMFFFAGAMACLLCSTLFHMFANHSEGVFHLFIRLDYSGIAFLITGSSVPAYYYGFYCTTISGFTHISILLVLCAMSVMVSMRRKFSTPKYRPLRFAVFVLFGLYGVVPALHILLREGYTQACTAYAPWSLGAMGAVYIIGAVLYVLRIPERFSPGRFDIWASSHQLFHICVIMAALVHYDTLLSMIKYRLDVGGCINSLPMDMLAVY
jgi:adiponectin receptor